MAKVLLSNVDTVGILRLNNGITNALNLEFIQDISSNLQDLKNDTAINSIVLTSDNEKFYSIGFDLPQLFNETESEVKQFYQTYNRLSLELYTFPKPTITAIRGHAIAGGCILALCTDYRFIAYDRKLMGLNEIKLGLPVPYPAACVLRDLIGTQNAKIIMEEGEFHQADDLFQMGLVDSVLPINEVLPKSIKKARELGALPKKAYGIIKRNRVESVEGQILEHLNDKEQIFLECWQTPEVRELLKEAIKKF